MNLYKKVLERHKEEQQEKKSLLYSVTKKTVRVTRFIPTKVPYSNSNTDAQYSPTMFTPWGKTLGNNPSAPKETVSHALQSMCAQFFYDILWTIAFTMTAIPMLVLGLKSLGDSFLAKEGEEKLNAEKRAELYFSNVLLAPYFAISIVVDFLREFCAIFTRTYATIMQTEEQRNTPYVTMG